MIVGSNFAIEIATHTDWLKNLALVFQPMRNKTNRSLNSRFLLRCEYGDR